jgi:hypothetical protein
MSFDSTFIRPPQTVTIQGEGSVTLGGSGTAGPEKQEASVKLEGTGKAGASTTFTVKPGVSTTNSTQITDGPGSPPQQMAAAKNNITSGSSRIASSIEKGGVVIVNPLVSVAPNASGPPSHTAESFTLTNTDPTNRDALTRAHQLAIDEANLINPVKRNQ